MDTPNGANAATETTLADVQKEVTELKDLFYRRLMNDKQKTELINSVSAFAQFSFIEPFLNDILLLLDRVDRHDGDFAASVGDELFEIINRRGVERVDTTGAFNPEQHRAVRTEESPFATGTILSVVRNGFSFNGKIFRPADVVVAKNNTGEAHD